MRPVFAYVRPQMHICMHICSIYAHTTAYMLPASLSVFFFFLSACLGLDLTRFFIFSNFFWWNFFFGSNPGRPDGLGKSIQNIYSGTQQSLQRLAVAFFFFRLMGFSVRSTFSAKHFCPDHSPILRRDPARGKFFIRHAGFGINPVSWAIRRFLPGPWPRTVHDRPGPIGFGMYFY